MDWTELEAELEGNLVLRGSAAYESDRGAMLWNARKVGRFPDAIVHVRSEEDVRTAVRFAGKRRLKVSVRSGGHHLNGSALRRGGLLLDLSQFKEIDLDASRCKALVRPAATSRDLLAALTPHSLAFPVGHCPTVAMGGYLLGGGVGWNGGAWGPACLNLEGIEMVDGQGQSLYADAVQYADLLWLARGAGPGLPGVVTRYHLKVHPLPRAMRTSTLIYRFSDVNPVAEWLARVVHELPTEVELVCLAVSLPPVREGSSTGTPERLIVVSATAFAETESDAQRWLGPIEAGPTGPAPVSRDFQRDTPFESLLATIDGVFPENHRYAADVVWSNASPKDLLARVCDQVLAVPSARSLLLLNLRPANAAPVPNMAFSMCASAFVGIYGIWDDPAQDAVNEAWVRATSARLDPIKDWALCR